MELRIRQITPLGGDKYEVIAWTPVDGYMAPPGYYMLTVTATTNMPSPAEWIRLEDPQQ